MEPTNITAEERIAKLEAQCKSMLEEIEQLKKELAEEKQKNSKLTEENKSLKEENKVLREENKSLKEENEQFKTRIVELESQLDTVHKNNPGFNPDAIAEIYKLQDQIKELTNKLETTNQKVEKLDKREMKSDSKILEMVNEVKESIKEEVKKEVYTCLGKPAEPVNPEPVQKPATEVKKPELPKEEIKADGGTITSKTDRINWKGFYDSLDD